MVIFRKTSWRKTLKLIENVIKKSSIPPLQEWDKQIIVNATARLFKDCIIPDNVINISKQKVHRILELISNTPTHIITKQISNFLLKMQTEQRI